MVLAICGLVMAALTGLLMRCAARRWWHYLVIAAAALPLLPLVATYLTGDVSRHLPVSAFSDGIDGKGEVIAASVYATVIVALVFATLGFWVVRGLAGKRARS